MIDPSELMNRIVEQKIREQMDRLEQEAIIFVRMGYEPHELTRVCHPNGEQEIAPLSALSK